MSQHDLTIDNQTFPLTRTDLNLALKALSEMQSGASAPAHLANGVLWLDTTGDPNILKMYNSGAPGLWMTIGEFAVSTGIFTTARLDGLTATVSELNKLDGVTATPAELNKLAGATATTAQLNFVTGVTSAIQTQLNAKAALASPALTGNPTAPTQATGNDTTRIATTAFVANSAIGLGQTWQDVSGSRVAGTSYQNTTGRPIQVLATVSRSASSDYWWQVSSNGSTWLDATLITGSAGANPAPSFGAVIPDTWYYRVSFATSMTVQAWLELR